MEFGRTISSRVIQNSRQTAQPRVKASTPVRLPAKGAGNITPRNQRTVGVAQSAQKPQKVSDSPLSARGSGSLFSRSETFRRCKTNATVSLGQSGGSGVKGQSAHVAQQRLQSKKTGGNGHVNVYVRVRAFTPEEIAEDRGQLAVRMKEETVDVNVPKKGRFTFTFDGTFWSNENPSEKPFADQKDVFEVVGKPLVENALAGYNAAIIAYGQTGSGKTFTAFGPPNSLGTPAEGLIPRVCEMIFSRADSSGQKGITYRVCVSMVEVYLEDVFDLLNHRKLLTVHNSYSDNSFQVVGAKYIPVRTYKEVAALLKKAEPLRTFAATAIHDRSSRAHTLFQLEVQTTFESSDIAPRVSKILLADLAGCERIKLAQTENGLPFEQARNINLSLLALGSCIEAVTTSKGSNSNIHQFRNSTLTKLLKEYLGGNSVSVMVVTIGPGLHDANLTVQTLRFADRAKQMTTHAKINTIKPVPGIDTGEDKLCGELRDAYLKKKEALYVEYQLQNTIEGLLKKIAILEAQLMEASDDMMISRLQEEIEEQQKNLAEADAQLQEQRRILYPNEVFLEEQLRETNTRLQEMKEEHEEAMECLITEDMHKYTEQLRQRERQYYENINNIQFDNEAKIEKLQNLLDEANVTIETLTTQLKETSRQLYHSDEKAEMLDTTLTDLKSTFLSKEKKLSRANWAASGCIEEHGGTT